MYRPGKILQLGGTKANATLIDITGATPSLRDLPPMNLVVADEDMVDQFAREADADQREDYEIVEHPLDLVAHAVHHRAG